MTQTALISGASGAVGQIVARTFAEAGWQLVLLGSSQSSADKLNEQFPDAFTLAADLSQPDAAKHVADEVFGTYPQLDAVLQVAGGFAMQSALKVTPADVNKLFAINFWTVFNLTSAVLPHLLEQSSGHIAAVSAGQALNGGGNTGAYAASKAAMSAYIKSVHAEVSKQGVTASVLYPMGTVDTDANRSAMPNADPNNWLDPQDIADTLLHMVTRSNRGRMQEVQLHAK